MKKNFGYKIYCSKPLQGYSINFRSKFFFASKIKVLDKIYHILGLNSFKFIYLLSFNFNLKFYINTCIGVLVDDSEKNDFMKKYREFASQQIERWEGVISNIQSYQLQKQSPENEKALQEMLNTLQSQGYMNLKILQDMIEASKVKPLKKDDIIFSNRVLEKLAGDRRELEAFSDQKKNCNVLATSKDDKNQISITSDQIKKKENSKKNTKEKSKSPKQESKNIKQIYTNEKISQNLEETDSSKLKILDEASAQEQGQKFIGNNIEQEIKNDNTKSSEKTKKRKNTSENKNFEDAHYIENPNIDIPMINPNLNHIQNKDKDLCHLMK